MTLLTQGRLKDNVKIDHFYDADGAITAGGASDTFWLDMKDFGGCMFIIMPSGTTPTSSHYMGSANVVSNTTSAGAGTDHIIAEAVTTDGGTTDTLTTSCQGIVSPANGAAGFIVLDVKAEQIYEGDRYVSIVTTMGAGTVITHVVAIRYNGTNCYKDMFIGTPGAYQYDGDLT